MNRAQRRALRRDATLCRNDYNLPSIVAVLVDGGLEGDPYTQLVYAVVAVRQLPSFAEPHEDDIAAAEALIEWAAKTRALPPDQRAAVMRSIGLL